MRARISRYLTERSQLFSAISHDLRTPITRLRLRVELLEDEQLQYKFGRDLDELEMLVKGAAMRERHRYSRKYRARGLESPARLFDRTLFAPPGNGRVTLQGRASRPYPGKPLALRRCMGNLIDNALKYGKNAHLRIDDNEQAFVLTVDDEGPGCPSNVWSRSLNRTFAWPDNNRVTAWGWGLPAALPIATAAKPLAKPARRRVAGLLCTCREMAIDRQAGLLGADGQQGLLMGA